MSFLSSLFGNYADDLAKAAARTATKNTAKTAARTIASSQSDDIIKSAGKALAANADDTTKTALRNISKNIGSTAEDFTKTSTKSLSGQLDDATKIAGKAKKATATQKIAEKNRQDFAASLGASTKQRKNLYTKYRLGNEGENIGDYLSRQNVSLANIGDKSDIVLSQLGDVKNGLLQRAEDAGVTIDMPSAINWNSSSLKKADLKQINDALGIDLQNDLLNQAMTPTQAEKLYMDLRNRAYSMMKNDNTAMAGDALKKAVDELGDKIDDAIENAKVGYGLTQKTTEAMTNAGLDPKDIRKIAEMGDNITAKDLRTLQQPWVVARDMVGNKAPREATLNIAGIDTGLPNVVKGATEKIKDLPLKAQALVERNPNLATAGLIGAGIAGGSVLGNLLSGGNQGAVQGAGTMGGYGTDLSGAMSDTTGATSGGLSSLTGDASSEPTINGWTYNDLETAYFNAMMAGDTDAAKVAAQMLDVLSNKAERLKESQSSSGIASKQKAAINILNNLMGNFQAKGTIGGNVSQFLNMLTGGGYDPQQYAYDTGSKGSLGSIIKALGDTGALSEGDQQRALQLLPSSTDTAQAAQIKYQQLMQILQSAGQQ